MREIKFRAWNPDAKFMLSQGDMKNIRLEYIMDASYPLMQYTGLKDKNGVEIFEGDIISSYSPPSEVFFADGSFMTNIEPGSYLEMSQNSFRDDFEVIGNVYQNPELLK